jgi:hypothetical protein
LILSLAEYLRRINPTHRNSKGQWVIGSEPRQRASRPRAMPLLAEAGTSLLRSAVAISPTAPRSRLYGSSCAAIVSCSMIAPSS